MIEALSLKAAREVAGGTHMYTPPHFLETDLSRLDWLVAHDPFGTLISTVDSAPFATHLPVMYRRDGRHVTLEGHWAKPNPQWKSVEQQTALFIFHGPHAYISPRWYEHPAQQVPTWNYATAHLYGAVKVIQDHDQLASIVSRLSAHYEGNVPNPWSFESSSGAQRLSGIVGFEFRADRIELKFKLSQNRGARDIDAAVQALESLGNEDAITIASLMREHSVDSAGAMLAGRSRQD